MARVRKGASNKEIRKVNIHSILLLLKDGALGAGQISNTLGLSRPAVLAILDEMVNMRLIKNIATEQEKYARTLYSISNESGLISIVEFGSTYIKLVFANLTKEILFEKIFENIEFPQMKDLNIILGTLKEIIQYYLSLGLTTRNVLISAPGKINRLSEEIISSPKFMNINTSLKKLFEEQLGLPVTVKNDTNLALLGETDALNVVLEDAILLYVDSGIGGAILNKGRIVEGENGYAAEFGLIKTFDDFGNHIYYDLLCSINSIKKKIRYQQTISGCDVLKNDFRYRDVVSSFKNGDELVVNIIKKTAYKIGELINNLSVIYDFSTILIGGRIRDLGDKYLEFVKEKLEFEIDVKYTKYGDEAIIFGALSAAVNNCIELIINDL